MKQLLPTVLISVLAVAVSCGGDDASGGGPTKSSTPISAAARKEADALFSSLCTTCHGSTGHGDGPGAANMDPKPRSFSDVAWQDSVTDAQIEQVIVLGGAAVGKNPMMPAQPQLKGKKAVLAALVEKVRAFRGK